MEIIFVNIKSIVKPSSIAILMLSLSQVALAMENPANGDLIYASCVGDLAKAQAALDRGADVNLRGGSDFTPLHIAAIWGQKEVVKFLLDHNARTDYVDVCGETALEFAKKSYMREQNRKYIAQLIAKKRGEEGKEFCNKRLLEGSHANKLELIQPFTDQRDKVKQAQQNCSVLSYAFDFLLVASDILLG
jgi:hypothetical protein